MRELLKEAVGVLRRGQGDEQANLAQRIQDYLTDAEASALIEPSVKTISFAEHWKAMQSRIHQNAVEHGFWPDNRSDGECIALIHSELSEALEALRHGNPPDDHIPEYSGAEAELADVVIWVMDFAEARGLSVYEAMQAKVVYNSSRPYKHGKKF